LPDLKKVTDAISKWVKTDFPEALFKQSMGRKSIRFVEVDSIDRLWETEKHWVVEASLKYAMEPEGNKIVKVALQLNDAYEVVGFDLTKTQR
jgi:hypothetical protein